MARLAALVPTPRILTRYHGAINRDWRAESPMAGAGDAGQTRPGVMPRLPTSQRLLRHVSMTPDQVRGRLWAQRLKRVFKIDRLTCEHCGGAVKVIASIEDSVVIKQILAHLERRAAPAMPVFRPFARAPPPTELPGLRELG